MKNTYRIISLLLFLLLLFPLFSSSEEPDAFSSELDEYEELIKSYLDEGMTIRDIADLMDEDAAASDSSSALSFYGSNYLLLTHEIIVREIVLRGLPIDCTTIIHGMSYDELVSLNKQINLAMWQSAEWQEVTVPEGVWKVGEDIPAGHWTVRCADGWTRSNVEWGEYLSENGEYIRWKGRYSAVNYVHNPNSASFDPYDDKTEYSFEVREGEYIVIEEGSCVFMPYKGKPGLGFK